MSVVLPSIPSDPPSSGDWSLLHFILDAVPVLISYIDQEQRYLFNNRAYEEWFQLSRADIHGKHVQEVVGTRAYQVIRPYLEAALAGHTTEYDREVPYQNGPSRWINATYIPHRNAAGEVEGVIAFISDITAQKRTEQRQQLLIEASRLLGSSLDYQATLQTVAHLAVPILADWCVVYSIEEGDQLREMAMACVSPTKAEILAQIRAHAPPNLHTPHAIIQQLRAGEVVYTPTLDEFVLRIMARDPIHLDLLRRLEMRSMISLPLVARGQLIGILSFVTSTESNRQYQPEDVALAEELAGRAALAIDNARLYEEAWAAERHSDETLALLDTFLATAPVGLAFFDHEFRFIRINETLAAINRVPMEAHIGRKFGELFPQAVPQLEPLFQHVLTTGEPIFDREIEGALLGGRSASYLVSYYPISTADHVFLGVGALVIDVTAQRQAERERAELLAREQAARRAAEEAQVRFAFLAEASQQMASSLDYETTLTTVAKLAVPLLADWCMVDILQPDGSIRRIAVIHVNPAKEPLVQRLQKYYPPDANAPSGVPHVIRTGIPIIFPNLTPEQRMAVASSPAHLELLTSLEVTSVMCLPLIAHGQTLGAISFNFCESQRHHQPEDLLLAEELLRRAALAIDHARLYTAEQHNRQAAETAREIAYRAADRSARLQAITSALAGTMNTDEVAQIVGEQCGPILNVSSCLIAQVSVQDNIIELVNGSGYPLGAVAEWRRLPLDAPLPLPQVIRTGLPLFLETRQQVMDQFPAMYQASTPFLNNAWALIPLQLDQRMLGGVVLGFSEERVFTPEERAFLLAVGQQCAQALERGRLYDAAQVARAEAEAAHHQAQEAINIRDIFFSVASHELKTPVTAIQGYAELLIRRSQKRGDIESGNQRAVSTIYEQTLRLRKLIDLLLDFSRIQSGRLTIVKDVVDLHGLARRVAESLQQTLDHHTLVLMADDTPLLIEGDEMRLEQVFLNLISNAAKYSPGGGMIRVQLRRAGQETVITVADQGIGIPSHALPHIFTPFYRAENGGNYRIEGAGLGLAVVKEIVALHQGKIEVESEEGRGTLFRITLPMISA